MASPTGLPSLNRLLEASVYVDDLDHAEAFYADVLGLERIARQNGRHVFFRCGDMIVLVFHAAETCKAAPPGALPVPVHGAVGAGHICFAVDGDLLPNWCARLKAAGVAIEADFLWPNGARSVYFRDPAGNSLELAEPKLWASA